MFEVVSGQRKRGLHGLGAGIPTASTGLHALLLFGVVHLGTDAGLAPAETSTNEEVTFLRIRPAPVAAARAVTPASPVAAPVPTPAERAEPAARAVPALRIPDALAEVASVDVAALLPTGTADVAAGWVPQAMALEIEERPSVAAPATPRSSSDAITDGSLLSERPALLNAYAMKRALRRLYPDSLASERIEGKALVGFEIEKNGKVDLATFDLIYTSHPAFGAAALESIKELRFRPARLRGWPVRVRVHFPMHWKLPR